MTTILSHKFGFGIHRSIDVTGQESAWRLGSLELNPPSRPGGRFIYALRCLPDGSGAELQMEYFCDENGLLSVCDGAIRRIHERTDVEVTLVETGETETRLPHTINGKKTYYKFFASRVRLPVDAIVELQNRPPDLIPWLDFELDDSYQFQGTTDGSSSTVGARFVGAVDPFTISDWLSSRYLTACNALLNYTTEYAGQSAASRSRVRERQRVMIVARMLRSVMDSDPSDNLSIRDNFRDGSGNIVRDYIRNYEDTVRNLTLTRDRLGAELTKYLASDFTTFSNELFRIQELDDYFVVLDAMGRATTGLNECPNGRARLGQWVDNPPYWVRVYVLPNADIPDIQFQAGRKSTAAISTLWGEFWPALVQKLPARATLIMEASIRFVSRQELVRIQQVTETVRLRSGALIHRVSASYQQVVLIQVSELRVRVDAWVQPTTGPKHAAVAQVLERLSQGLEAINLLLAANGFLQATAGNRNIAAINLLGSCLDTVVAFRVLLRMSNVAVRVAGIASAMIDAALAARDAHDAYTRNDTASLIGFTAVSVGATLTLVGCACALAGGAAAPTIVGLPAALVLEVIGAVLVAAGWLVAAFGADSDIETYVRHCYFGHNYGTGSAQPSWSDGTLASWSQGEAGANRQVRSLYNLLAAFTLDSSGYTGVTILPGLLCSGSYFEMEFDALYNLDITHRPTVRIDIESRTMIHVSGDVADLTCVSFNEVDGRLRIGVVATWPPDKRPANAVQHQRCDCRVFLSLGTGSSTVHIPISGNSVSYRIHTLGTGLNGSDISSKGF